MMIQAKITVEDDKSNQACQCSGEKSPYHGTGDHCAKWDSDGLWCYVTQGTCSDEVPSQGSELYWSLLACKATCECSTPNTGTAGHNGYECTDGTSAYCSSDQECYATSAFTKGDWASGCRLPTCECSTPNTGTAGHNGYECTDGTSAYCSSDQECYATSAFTKGDWASG